MSINFQIPIFVLYVRMEIIFEEGNLTVNMLVMLFVVLDLKLYIFEQYGRLFNVFSIPDTCRVDFGSSKFWIQEKLNKSFHLEGEPAYVV